MEAGVRVESHPENSSGRLLRSGLKGDAEIRNLFLEAFNERRSGEERAGFMADLESEMRRQIAAFANRDRESVIGYAKRYDAARTGGAVSYLKAETADLDAALEAGYFDYKPNPRRVTLERLLRGDLPGDILSLPRDTIIMPVMSCGMFFASGIISALMEHGFSPDIAMAGYPRHELFWKNGESVAQKVCSLGFEVRRYPRNRRLPEEEQQKDRPACGRCDRIWGDHGADAGVSSRTWLRTHLPSCLLCE
ncbi:MAG: hypothetical protein M1160_02035 [Candidatus Marsarchaeota archaeon]|nr:hypothetical protein [Candidatus Marsarchaeota archaeon]